LSIRAFAKLKPTTLTTIDQLAALKPQLTEEEIDAEIAAARAERARRR
jgi:hypothetical protein